MLIMIILIIAIIQFKHYMIFTIIFFVEKAKTVFSSQVFSITNQNFKFYLIFFLFQRKLGY